MKSKFHNLFIILASLAGLSQAAAQGTAFTYQGQLMDNGAPANGFYDLQFIIYNAGLGGSQAGPILTNAATAVSNGLFTVTLNFGAGIFTGSNYWLDIAARANGSGPFIELSPRQPLTPTPYAILASTSSNLSGTVNTAQLSGTVGNSQLASSSITVNAGAGLGGGGAVALGGSTTLNNAGVLSVTGNADITASTVSGAVTLGDTAASADTAGTIVKRDSGGNFSAASITLDGNLNLPATTATAGVIYSGAGTLVQAYGLHNFFAGEAGNLTLGGTDNTGVGYQALFSDTSGGYNTALGDDALAQNTTGFDNTAVGLEALYENKSGSNNIALGYEAGLNLTTGSFNIDIGNVGVAGENNTIRIGSGQTSTYLAGDVFLSGNASLPTDEALNLSGSLRLNDNNIYFRGDTDTNQGLGFFGRGSANGFFAGVNVNGPVLWGNGGGALGTFNGSQAAALFWNASGQVGIGTTSPSETLEVNGNVAVDGALYLPPTSAGPDIIYSGSFLFLYGDTNGNVFTGQQAGNTNTTGYNNTAVGLGALSANTSGSDNTANGYLAMVQNSSGSDNIALGYEAGYYLTSGSDNIDIGNSGVVDDAGTIRIGTDGVQTLCYLAGTVYANGTFVSSSDRNAKENFQPVDTRDVLDKVAAMPVSRWNYKQDATSQHIGPMAQDFYSAFNVGPDDKHITTVDEGGVALAAIQGLNQKLAQAVKAKETQIQSLQQQNDSLAQRLRELEATVKALAANK